MTPSVVAAKLQPLDEELTRVTAHLSRLQGFILNVQAELLQEDRAQLDADMRQNTAGTDMEQDVAA